MEVASPEKKVLMTMALTISPLALRLGVPTAMYDVRAGAAPSDSSVVPPTPPSAQALGSARSYLPPILKLRTSTVFLVASSAATAERSVTGFCACACAVPANAIASTNDADQRTTARPTNGLLVMCRSSIVLEAS